MDPEESNVRIPEGIQISQGDITNAVSQENIKNTQEENKNIQGQQISKESEQKSSQSSNRDDEALSSLLLLLKANSNKQEEEVFMIIKLYLHINAQPCEIT